MGLGNNTQYLLINHNHTSRVPSTLSSIKTPHQCLYVYMYMESLRAAYVLCLIWESGELLSTTSNGAQAGAQTQTQCTVAKHCPLLLLLLRLLLHTACWQAAAAARCCCGELLPLQLPLPLPPPSPLRPLLLLAFRAPGRLTHTEKQILPSE